MKSNTGWNPKDYNDKTMFYQIDEFNYEVSFSGSYTREHEDYEPDAVISLSKFDEDKYSAGFSITSHDYDRIPTEEMETILNFMKKLEKVSTKVLSKALNSIAQEVGAG